MKTRGLVVFDLDGTLLRGPTVCEVIAKELGRLPRMQEMEGLRDRDAIAAAREEMASWYVDVPSATLLEYLRAARLAPGVPRGLELLQSHDVAIGIASITWSFAVDHFAERLGIEHRLGTVLHASGPIEHVWSEHKAEWVESLATRLGVARAYVATVGDSVGDYGMFGVSDQAFFVGRRAPGLKADWLHWPDANIEDIARYLIETWQGR